LTQVKDPAERSTLLREPTHGAAEASDPRAWSDQWKSFDCCPVAALPRRRTIEIEQLDFAVYQSGLGEYSIALSSDRE